jgi:citrate lyase beta subunit
VPRAYRSRRSCLAVPGSSRRFLDKAQGLAADEVFLDLEDAVAPAAKQEARANVIAALRRGDWHGKVRAVRINGVSTGWAYRDVIDVVEQAGQQLDVIVLPKVCEVAQVSWLDLLLGQIEQAMGYPAGQIGIEAQIEDAAGLAAVDAIAAASRRLEALGFDGKWVLHPGQIDPVNTAFSPDQAEYDHAELILAAYEHATTVERRGAAMLGEQMIDEASRKLALTAAARGRAAGLTRTRTFQPP